ncbi:MAG TPA: hypothetical protein VN634_12890 [Candidatus Limnocylindrales bacterium]|jgi:hypothetical protein|nr:hypothetical protein [Candidatus Limnocylindrales bacterium]
MKMQRIVTTMTLGLALGLLANASVSYADMESTTTTKSTTYSGVVSQVDPSSSTIILKSESSPSPVTYTYSKETTFVDSTGRPVSADVIMNSPVTVEYSTEGGRTIVRRVVQTGPARTTTKTTHTETETR